jgi:hypothetical protein
MSDSGTIVIRRELDFVLGEERSGISREGWGEIATSKETL